MHAEYTHKHVFCMCAYMSTTPTLFLYMYKWKKSGRIDNIIDIWVVGSQASLYLLISLLICITISMQNIWNIEFMLNRDRNE